MRRTKPVSASTKAGSLRNPPITSTSFMSGGGLKKCRPPTRPGLPQPAAISVTDSEEVLVAITASGAMRCSSARNNSRLAASSSTIASITMPAGATSSSEPIARKRPTVPCLISAVMRPFATWASSALSIAASASRAAPSRESNSSAVMPACAQTCAMPRPMVPAPMTATIRSGRCRSCATLTSLRMSVYASPGTRACLPSGRAWRTATATPCAPASARCRAARSGRH